MSMRYQYGECDAYINSKDFGDDSAEWATFCQNVDCLMWTLVAVGFPPKSPWKITADNWEEIFTRIYGYEKVSGAYRQSYTVEDGYKPFPFTPLDIYQFIGLEVNAGNKTTAEYRKWLLSLLEREARGQLDRQHSKWMEDDQAASEVATHA